MIGSVVTITVHLSQVRFKSKLPRENFRANVAFKELDVTNAVNRLQMLLNSEFIHKISTADLTHVPGACWSWRVYSKMDAIYMFPKAITSLEVLGTKLTMERLEATQAVNRPTMATLAAQIRKDLVACFTLELC